MKSSLKLLWLLWLVLCCVLAGILFQHHKSERQAILQSRRSMVLDGIQDLRSSLASLEQLGDLLLQTSVKKLEDSESFAELEEMGQPYFQLYLIRESQVLYPKSGAPPWIVELVFGLEAEQVLRPMPPGYSLSPSKHEQPDNYLLFAAPTETGKIVVWSLDWNYFSQVWLARRIERIGLGGELNYHLLDLEEALTAQNVEWSWTLPTLLPEKVHQLAPLRLELDISKSLEESYREDISTAIAGTALLLGFALALWSSTRNVQREAELADEKAQFVSLVSHELRTPVSCIEMYLEILRENLVDDPEKVAEYHRILQRESSRLRSLVENLLRLGLAEAAGRPLEKKNLDLTRLLRRVVETENREKRPVSLELPESCEILGDEDALYGIFANLLGNALKYSPANSEVEIELKQSEGGLRISFLDRGEALSANDYEPLFSAYERRHKDRPGLGLGLTLARKLGRSQNCKIHGEPRAEGGSIFSVQWSQGDFSEA